MGKCIVILDGISEGKSTFDRVAKKNNYWVWNVNHRNVLSVLTRKLYWNGKKDLHYYNFIEEFESLCNEYWEFDFEYINKMIQTFMENEKATLLVVHNCTNENKDKLQELYPTTAFSVFISEDDVVNEEYSKTINCRSEDYENKILEVLNILTKE